MRIVSYRRWILALVVLAVGFSSAAALAAQPSRLSERSSAIVAASSRCLAATDLPAAECDALLAFHAVTGGENWAVPADREWRLDRNPCTHWEGVSCDSGHVVEVWLPDANLTGDVEDAVTALGPLTHLRVLTLTRNNLSGQLPASIGNFPHLMFLHLGVNELTGSIPSALSGLENLVELDLSHNDFTPGPIPAFLSQMPALQVLNLSATNRTGSIPTALGSTNLADIRLDANELSGNIPSSLGNLSELRFLTLSNNNLSGTIPSSLTKLTKLEALHLHTNNLSGSVPDGIMNLSLLKKGTLSLLNNGCLWAVQEVADWLTARDPHWQNGCGD